MDERKHTSNVVPTFDMIPMLMANLLEDNKILSAKLDAINSVIVKTCSDSLFSIGQKNCQLFVAKLRNFLDSHNRMVLY